MVNCLSFCELISIDVQKFQSLMREALPELFDMLVIYSAIDHDCPKAMLHCLKEQGISQEMSLLFGEGVLHHCAKVNAAACAEHLIQHLGADATLLTEQEGQTPAQLAAELKHKETFWAMMQCAGSSRSVTDADVLPQDARSVRPKRRQTLTWTEDHREPYTLARVQELFDSCKSQGSIFGGFGRDGRKGLEDLVSELNTCQSDLVILKQSLLRRVRLVRLRVLASIDDSFSVLVELQSDAWLKAQDQKIGKLPQRRLHRQETVQEATETLMQELGVSISDLEAKLVVPLARTCHVETRMSMSYPGLETEYTIYESTWKVRAQAVQKAREIGLPKGRPFTREFCAHSFRMVSRQFIWAVLFDFQVRANPDTPTESFRVQMQDEELGNESGSWGVNPLRLLLWRSHPD